MAGFDFAAMAAVHAHWIDAPGYPLQHDFPREEYELRIARARRLLESAGLDALVITSSAVGQWFTSALEPHEWHDQCSARSCWFILTPDRDVLLMTATAQGEHFNTTRRATWVSDIRAVVERADPSRWETWDLAQMPPIFAELGLRNGRLGFELGDCMTLGLSVNDFLRLRDLMPAARIEDASPVIRPLMSIHTPLEIERLRIACAAGVAVHAMVPEVLETGLTERDFLERLAQRFASRFGEGYSWRRDGGWDVRNPDGSDSNPFHSEITRRRFRAGDQVFRGRSGATYRGYHADIDRIWFLGKPPPVVRDWYRMTWECNRAMAEKIRPGNPCSDIYRAARPVEERYGIAERQGGRIGHGYRNTGGLSVHPDNHTILQPGMIISVEPMYANAHGFYDLEDQYLVTETGAECLHELAPEQLPVIPA